MNGSRNLLLAVAVLGIIVSLPIHSKSEYLKEVPKAGEIPYGRVVYVDDGTCPKGEIKEITGGSREKAIKRTTRCVKRPL